MDEIKEFPLFENETVIYKCTRDWIEYNKLYVFIYFQEIIVISLNIKNISSNKQKYIYL